MSALPATQSSLLVRTYFGDDVDWDAVSSAATAENADGFRAYVELVNDVAWDGASSDRLRAAVLEGEHAAVLFVVDRDASVGEYPILVVDLGAEVRESFRCIAAELWSVDNNLNIANMDWEEFATATDADGIHRGFE